MFHLLIIKLTCMPTEKTSYGDLSHILKKKNTIFESVSSKNAKYLRNLASSDLLILLVLNCAFLLFATCNSVFMYL